MWILLVLAGLLLFLSAFAVWVNRVALNTDVFVDTSSELIEDDEIRSAVSTKAVDELFEGVDVQAELEMRFPADYKALSGPAAAGLQQASYTIVDRALERPAFQRLWTLSLRESHRTLVAVLEGGSDTVTTEGGVVTLDLRQLVVETADRIGIGGDLAQRIPEDAGVIEVLEADDLDTAQDAAQLLKTLAWVLPLLTLLAFGAVVWLARDRRRVVRRIGATLLAVGVVGLLALRLVGNYIVDSLVNETENRAAAANAWDILTELLRGSFWTMIPTGIVFLVAAWLAGPSPRATGIRGAFAAWLRGRVWPYVALALIAVVLLWTSPVTDLSRLLVIAVLVGLGALWIELMRRQAMREFPDAETPTFLSDARAWLSEWWEELPSAAPAPAPAPAPTPAASATPAVAPPTDLTSRLSSLAELHRSGALTDDEYASAKARVLAGE